jgi:hypothetical protein
MSDLLDGLSGARLTHDAYDTEFGWREAAACGDSWKLERQQHFCEPDSASWVAFSRGDWDEALRLMESRRDEFKQLTKESATRGMRLLRVRVVEQPIGPYLQWELNSLRIRAQCGELIHVVGPELVREYEASGPLPEIINLGPDVFYQIIYDENGVGDGAFRYTGVEETARVVEFIRRLYDVGEDIATYFDREVAHLEPPRGE